jgi:hypothetical protein
MALSLELLGVGDVMARSGRPKAIIKICGIILARLVIMGGNAVLAA